MTALHRYRNRPLKSCTPMVAKITIVNMNRIMMLIIDGTELSNVLTSPAIPGIELIVLNGLKIRITLTGAILFSSSLNEIQPRMTTPKSSYT